MEEACVTRPGRDAEKGGIWEREPRFGFFPLGFALSPLPNSEIHVGWLLVTEIPQNTKYKHK